MNTKTQAIHQKLKDIQKQIAELQKRQDEVSAEQNQTQTSVASKKNALSSDIISGVPIDKTVSEITVGDSKVIALNEAYKEIAARLSALEVEQARVEWEIAADNYEQTAADARKKLFSCVRLLDQFKDIYSSIAFVTKPTDYVPTDKASITRNMWEHLGELDITRKLKFYNEIAGEFMSEAINDKGAK